jgi:hypothetical protein
MAKSVAVWGFGLLAAAIFGGMVGSRLVPGDGPLLGVLGGLFAFACARLWAAGPSQNAN